MALSLSCLVTLITFVIVIKNEGKLGNNWDISCCPFCIPVHFAEVLALFCCSLDSKVALLVERLLALRHSGACSVLHSVWVWVHVFFLNNFPLCILKKKIKEFQQVQRNVYHSETQNCCLGALIVIFELWMSEG